jgi:hypothetical protein
MSLKDKLNSIINSSLSNNYRSNNNLIQYKKIHDGNKGEIISEVKGKINEFKLNRQQNQPVDLLNFEVNRETLSKYYKNNSSRDLNRSFNQIKKEIELNDSKVEKNLNDLKYQNKNYEKKNYQKKNYLNIDIKNIFKNNNKNDNNNNKNNSKLNKSFDKIKIKNNDYNNNKKEYIKIFNYKENDYNNNKNEENNKNDKIKTQINLFVKQLNFSPFENSNKKKNKSKVKNNDNFYNNYSTYNSTFNNILDSNLKLEDIKKLNKNLDKINEPSLLSNEIISELKILNNKLNIIFNNN